MNEGEASHDVDIVRRRYPAYIIEFGEGATAEIVPDGDGTTKDPTSFQLLVPSGDFEIRRELED